MLRKSPPAPVPRPHAPLAVCAGCLCALATAAAVVSFARDGAVGIVWVLLAGLASNMTWYHWRWGKGRADAAVGCERGATGGACGGCVKTVLKESRR